MKRTVIVWLFSIIVLIGMLWNLLGIIGLFSGFVIPMSIFAIVLGIINLILLVFTALMIYHFFMLKKKAEYWTHIAFGATFIVTLFQEVFITPIISPGFPAPSIFFVIIRIAIYALFWWAIVNYIRKKKVEGQPLFN